MRGVPKAPQALQRQFGIAEGSVGVLLEFAVRRALQELQQADRHRGVRVDLQMGLLHLRARRSPNVRLRDDGSVRAAVRSQGPGGFGWLEG